MRPPREPCPFLATRFADDVDDVGTAVGHLHLRRPQFEYDRSVTLAHSYRFVDGCGLGTGFS